MGFDVRSVGSVQKSKATNEFIRRTLRCAVRPPLDRDTPKISRGTSADGIKIDVTSELFTTCQKEEQIGQQFVILI